MRTTAELVGVRLLLVPFVAIALTVGCGKENVVQSTTGPSTLTSAAALSGDPSDGEPTSSIAGEAGTLEKGGNGHGNKGNSDGDEGNGDDDENDDDGKKPQNGNGPGRSHEDRVVGFVSAKTADTLTVRGVTVTAAAGAIIRHGHRILTLADIQVGDHVQARGRMDGSTLVATEIKVQDTGNDNEDDDGDVDETELEGTISNLSSNGNCPVVTFTIGGETVKTSAATVFDDVTCANLANNARVEVEGIEQADGSILATRVEAEAGPDEVVGIVFEFSGSGSCPTATFKVGPTLNSATTITTTASTTFSGVTCATLSNGATVEVEGTKQANGSITAASVERK